ncbi:sugar O-acetyltransferase [Peribacillus muralis]|uniref:maltose acetyltransferase domain-containing protein n=1 Tax=Peribacillus muralis TaxID=264697 RepID=UPI001F4E721B|nr:maltose acetyltransferase domain-containing protein [Peribacillus muralis]MCK1995351.1 sugar O-acetyltransferase [Peribacillus muralis]MCK2015882.1 sugar O-acetyltransferase [Peribacillus muralis]
MTQRENIKNGSLFTDMGEGLPEERLRGKELVYDFNHTRPSEVGKREVLAKQLFGSLGENCWIEPPIHFAYGSNTFIGNNFYANFNLTIVDDTTVKIGNGVLMAPNVTISTTGHPIDPELRTTGQMYAFTVVIEDNVWIGSGAVINPGVTIGKNSVIGAGSIVTKDIPPNVVAVGSPCKVLRKVNHEDKIYYYKNRKVQP